ncbi:MAG: 2-dehydro-3-deoxygalactonokinase [Chitinophagaceae bacterium]
MNTFISCDWGTSNLRLRLVDKDSKRVLKEVETNEGIASIYHSWKNEATGTDRFSYYLSVLNIHIGKWRNENIPSLENIPVLVSGMASSTIGIMELEYAPMPIRSDGSGLLVKKINGSTAFPFPLFIISGASTSDDAMRGEETLLAGCDTQPGKTELFIFPGTHSKHVRVTDGVADNLASYMTGELFALLSRQSVLSASVEEPENDRAIVFFEKGIIEGSQMNLLNRIFQVRINHLFKKATATENFDYLSGLLIGAELSSVKEKNFDLVTVVAGEGLMNKYLAGLRLLDTGKKINQLDAGIALVNGHCKIISAL